MDNGCAGFQRLAQLYKFDRVMKKLHVTQAARNGVCSVLRAFNVTCIALLVSFSQLLFAQTGVRIATAAGTADPSAMLDVVSTSKGVLIPRMLASERTGIASPANGLLVFQTDGTPGFYYNAGTPAAPNWIILSAGAISGVGLANSVARWTTSSLLGTGVITDNGTNVGIGITNPQFKLDVNGNIGLNRNSILFQENNGSVATDGTYGIYWHSSGVSPSPNYGIYRTPGAWTGNTYQQLRIQFDTGIQLGPGTGNNAGYDKSYVDIINGKGLMVSSGSVGIGTTTPAEKLDVAGNIRSSNLSGSNIHLAVDANGVIKKLALAYVTGNGPEDGTDVGFVAGRTLTFTKQEASTKIRISYTDNLRTYCPSAGKCCRWSFRIDGNNCPSQFLGYDFYCGVAGENQHVARTLVGYCGSLGAGSHTLQIYVDSCPSYSGSDCYTGWQSTEAWLLEVEEVY